MTCERHCEMETSRVDGVDAVADRRLAAAVGPDDHRERALELDGLFPIWGEGSNAADGELLDLGHGRSCLASARGSARRSKSFSLRLARRRRLAAWFFAPQRGAPVVAALRWFPCSAGDQRLCAARGSGRADDPDAG